MEKTGFERPLEHPFFRCPCCCESIVCREYDYEGDYPCPRCSSIIYIRIVEGEVKAVRMGSKSILQVA